MGKRIIVDLPGTIIRVKEGVLTLARGAKLVKIRFDDLDELRLGPGMMISTDVLIHAVNAKTMILIADSKGELVGIFMPATYTGTVKTQREQIRAYDDARGLTLAKSFAKTSILTRAALLNYLASNRVGTPEEEILKNASLSIEEKALKIDNIVGKLDEIRQQIMAIEANAAEIYFKTLQYVIPEKYCYMGKRTRRPPEDPFNAAISFVNNRIREIALQAVIAAGLHPYFGFLHADKPGRFSMALDLAEEFIVPVGHTVAIKLFVREIMKETDFVKRGKAVFLSKEGRDKVLRELEEKLAKKIRFKGVNTTIRGAIYRQARHLASYLKGETENYVPAKIPLH